MPVVSIIVPVYNQEFYLRECLESISLQSFSDFEAILIDDGSTDLSMQICEEYALKDRRFITDSKSNGGVSSARNVGLEQARGEFVLFVDADDRLPKNALEIHLANFSSDVDITTGSFVAFSGKDYEEYRVEIGENALVSTEKCLLDFTPNGGRDWQRYLWNRMMRRSVIERFHLRFNENIHYKEDGLFLVQYLLRCKGKVAYFPEIVYCYRQNPASAMGALSIGQTGRLATNIDAHAQIIKEMRNARVENLILGREISHAFQSRNWVIDLFKKSGNGTFYIGFSSLLKLYCAVGPKRAIKAIREALNRRLFSFSKR